MAVIVLAAQLPWRRQMRNDIFDMRELAGVGGIGSPGHELNLILDGSDTVSRIWMIGQKLRRRGAALRLELLKQLSHLNGVISSLRHRLGPVVVGFALGSPGHFEEDGVRTETDSQLRQLSQDSSASASASAQQHHR